MIEHLRRLVMNSPFRLVLRRMGTRWVRIRYGLSGVHPTAYINFVAGVEITRDVKIAEYVYIGAGCMINHGVSIGRYTMLGPRVAIVGVDHRMDLPGKPMIFAGRPELKATVVGEDAWIGAGAVVMQGLTIGRGAVIGANAVVTKDVPPYEIWVGVPARRVGERFPNPDDRRRHDAMLDGPLVDPLYCT